MNKLFMPLRMPTFLALLMSILGLFAFPAVMRGSPAESKPPAGATPPSPAAGGLVTIESDLQQADNQTGIVTATGNVKITYPDKGMVATSRQAQYFSKEGRLILIGDVDVVDSDGQRIRAERLVYQLDQERLIAQPSEGKQVTSKLRLSSGSTPQRVGPPMP
jgi:lipopolysaccharide export system protein LptA